MSWKKKIKNPETSVEDNIYKYGWYTVKNVWKKWYKNNSR